MVVIHRKDGTKRTSHNLRGILDYARGPRQFVQRVVLDTHRSTGQALLDVTFYDGATVRAEFADWRVMRAWVAARRSWKGCEVLDLLPPE